MPPRWPIAFGVALIVAGMAPGAAAAPDEAPRAVPEARQHAADAAVERGRKLLVDGQFDAALQEFLLARDMAPAARITAHLAQAERALRRWVEAEQHLTETLASPTDPWVLKNRPLVERWLREVREHVGGLNVSGSPVGAKVKLNGEPVELLPFSKPLRLVVGKINVDVSAPGYSSFGVRLAITPDHVSEVDVRLVALPRRPSLDDEDASRPPKAPPLPALPRPALPSAPAPAPTSYTTGPPMWLDIGLIGAGLASIAGGAVLLKIDGHPTCDLSDGQAPCPHTRDTRISGAIALGAGTAAVLTGSFLVFLSRRSEVAVAFTPRSVVAFARF